MGEFIGGILALGILALEVYAVYKVSKFVLRALIRFIVNTVKEVQ